MKYLTKNRLPQKMLVRQSLIALLGMMISACSASVTSPMASSIPDTSSCLDLGTEIGTVFQIQQFRIACQRGTRIDLPLKGKVQAQDSAATLSGVKILQERLHPDGSWLAQDSVESDVTGSFSLNFSYGSYRLRFEKSGYQPLTQRLNYEYRPAETSSAETTNAITFKLTPETASKK